MEDFIVCFAKSYKSHKSQDLAIVYPVEAKATDTKSEVFPKIISLSREGCAPLLCTEGRDDLELPPQSTSSSDSSP